MPGRDRTGPAGMGAMTGRAAGYCAGRGIPGYSDNYRARGVGMVFGRGGRFVGRGGCGRGWRYGFNAIDLPGRMRFGGNDAPSQMPDQETEKQVLNNQASILQSELDFIKNRLGEIEKETP